MTTHKLKTWPATFGALLSGHKTFEFRVDDRGFAVGDTVVLEEWDPTVGAYTGRHTTRKITYVLREDFGVPEGYAVLALRRRGWRSR